MTIMDDLPEWTGLRSDGKPFCAECGAKIAAGLPLIHVRQTTVATWVDWHWLCFARNYGRRWHRLHQAHCSYTQMELPPV